MTFEYCYKYACKEYGPAAESLDVVKSVEQHRQHWRPDRVHTVLLAESHVYTPETELKEMNPQACIEGHGMPAHFVRFVYCLGYGESLFAGHVFDDNDQGTWQFWKLLSSAIRTPTAESFAPFLKTHSPDYKGRLVSKYELLNRLQQDGVWLLDASILALYGPGKYKPAPKVRKKIIEFCWENYIRQQIQEADPHSVLVVGKGVYKSLESKLSDLSSDIQVRHVSQPQGCRKREDIDAMHQTVFDVCKNARLARNAVCTDVGYAPVAVDR